MYRDVKIKREWKVVLRVRNRLRRILGFMNDNVTQLRLKMACSFSVKHNGAFKYVFHIANMIAPKDFILYIYILKDREKREINWRTVWLYNLDFPSKIFFSPLF